MWKGIYKRDFIIKNNLWFGKIPNAAPGFSKYVMWKKFFITGIDSPGVIRLTIKPFENWSSAIIPTNKILSQCTKSITKKSSI